MFVYEYMRIVHILNNIYDFSQSAAHEDVYDHGDGGHVLDQGTYMCVDMRVYVCIHTSMYVHDHGNEGHRLNQGNHVQHGCM